MLLISTVGLTTNIKRLDVWKYPIAILSTLDQLPSAIVWKYLWHLAKLFPKLSCWKGGKFVAEYSPTSSCNPVICQLLDVLSALLTCPVYLLFEAELPQAVCKPPDW